MKLLCATVTVFAVAFLALTSINATGVPGVINNQGRLTDSLGNPMPDGAYELTFTIYNLPAGGTTLWTSGQQTVPVVDGLFTYELGSAVSLPSDLFAKDTVLYLGIRVGSSPENAPRTRLTSVGYAYHAATADFAATIGNNSVTSSKIVNKTILFQDIGMNGATDGQVVTWDAGANSWTAAEASGMSQSEADNRYCNEVGDTLYGGLWFDSKVKGNFAAEIEIGTDYGNLRLYDHGSSTATLWGESYGELKLWDSDGDYTVGLNGHSAAGGELILQDNNGVQRIRLHAGYSGNSSALLPDDAIDEDEILNEPGIAATRASTSTTLDTIAMNDIQTVTITIPTSGYIVVEGKCIVRLSGILTENKARIQIDETEGGTQSVPYYVTAGMNAYTDLGYNFFPTYVQRIYQKSAGTYTFRMEGMQISGGSAVAWYPMLMATFYTTSYGSVVTVASDPGDHPDATAVTARDETDSGTSQTMYELDLRYYELQAKEARVRALQAELELQQARETAERRSANR